jgi:hypothetical protein
VPPATTRYKFYQACETLCSLWLDSTADSTSPTNIIPEHSTWSRRYYDKYDGQKSSWISLTAGQNYYIEGLTYNDEGADSFSVAVEIEQSSMTGHHHAIKEIQKIGVHVTETNRDTIRITIENMDSGNFRIAFYN